MSDIRFNQWFHNSGTGGVSQDSAGHVGIGTTVPTHVNALTNNNSILHVGIVSCNTLNSSRIEGTIDDWIVHEGDTNTKFGFPAADTYAVETAGQQNVQIDGTRTLLTSPSGSDTKVRLQHQGNSGYGEVTLDRSVNAFIIDNDPTNAGNNGTYFSVKNKGTESLRIDASGNVLIGDSAGQIGKLSTLGTGNHISAIRHSTDASSANFIFAKYRGSRSSPSVVANGDALGNLSWYGYNGSSIIKAADITAKTNGTVDGSNMTTDLIFSTTSGNTNTERLRITSAGDIGLGGITTPLWTTGGGMHLNDNYGIGFGNGGSGRPDFQIVTTGGATLDLRCGFGGDTADITIGTDGTVTIPAVAGTNTNSYLPVLFQTSAGVIEGGSGLTYNPGGDSFQVNGLTISQGGINGNASQLLLTCANHSSTCHIAVGSIVNIKNQATFTNNAASAKTAARFENLTNNGAADCRVQVATYSNGGADPFIHFDAGGSNMIVGNKYGGTTNNKLILGAGDSPSGTVKGFTIDGNGHVAPTANNTYDLGSSGNRWRNLYVNDLQLSNEAKQETGGNDVDGTWGDYTIQEGEEDLFLINNRSGKKYKFNLTEVS